MRGGTSTELFEYHIDLGMAKGPVPGSTHPNDHRTKAGAGDTSQEPGGRAAEDDGVCSV